jgi:O-antigen ligase
MAGPLGTESVGRRVRYLGPLNDPNEMSLAIGIAVPFAFGFFFRKRSLSRTGLMLGSLVLIAWCTVLTQSRGGQLVFMAVLGAYFIRQYGIRGALFGLVLCAPMLLLGGRSGEEAEASSLERIECMYEGMNMFRSYPIVGVGQGMFTEHHRLTAHNSYVLACAELGFIGMVIWVAVLYISMKIPIQVLRQRSVQTREAEVARVWAMALLASLIGLLVGIFFLSFCYHPVLWTLVGLSGALSSSMRTHDPGWRVDFTRKDLWNCVLITAGVIAVLWVYTRIKGASL